MNLNAYDDIKEKLDKTKTWVDVKRKILFSREIKYRPYISLLKRYNSTTSSISYFIAMLNKTDDHKNCKPTITDNYGRIKIRLSSIWADTYLTHINSNCNIVLNLIESDEDGDIYLLDV